MRHLMPASSSAARKSAGPICASRKGQNSALSWCVSDPCVVMCNNTMSSAGSMRSPTARNARRRLVNEAMGALPANEA